LMTTLLLRRHGWEVVYLGANVPTMDLEKVVISTRARMVILIASQLHTAANLFEAARMLRGAGIPLAFAGSIFSRQAGLIQSISGYYLGDRLDRVVQEVEAVLKHPGPAMDVYMPRNDYREAKIKIEDRQSMIKADIWDELRNNGMKEHTLQIANEALMQDILSALTLNNLDSLQMEIEWVGTLMAHQALPKNLLPEYLRVFAHSIDRHAGEAGKVVGDWLRSAASKQEMM
jgi:hypothetical protein